MPFANAAKFPANVVQLTDLGNLKDFVAGNTKPTLASGMAPGDSSFTLFTGSGNQLPADNFTVTIDQEEIFVATRSGDACSSLTRGINGTSAASHSSGAVVNQFIIANLLNQLSAEVNALESFPAWRLHPDREPASPNAMDDEFDGASFNPGSLWTNWTIGSVTNAVSKSWLQMTTPSNGGAHAWRGIEQVAPSPTWEFTGKFSVNADGGAGQAAFGLGMRESATAKIIIAQLIWSAGASLNTGLVAYFNSNTTFSANLNSGLPGGGTIQYFRIRYDNVNISFYMSSDGVSFQQLVSEAKATHFTTAPDRVGIYVDPFSDPLIGGCEWFRRTA